MQNGLIFVGLSSSSLGLAGKHVSLGSWLLHMSYRFADPGGMISRFSCTDIHSLILLCFLCLLCHLSTNWLSAFHLHTSMMGNLLPSLRRNRRFLCLVLGPHLLPGTCAWKDDLGSGVINALGYLEAHEPVLLSAFWRRTELLLSIL